MHYINDENNNGRTDRHVVRGTGQLPGVTLSGCSDRSSSQALAPKEADSAGTSEGKVVSSAVTANITRTPFGFQ